MLNTMLSCVIRIHIHTYTRIYVAHIYIPTKSVYIQHILRAHSLLTAAATSLWSFLVRLQNHSTSHIAPPIKENTRAHTLWSPRNASPSQTTTKSARRPHISHSTSTQTHTRHFAGPCPQIYVYRYTYTHMNVRTHASAAAWRRPLVPPCVTKNSRRRCGMWTWSAREKRDLSIWSEWQE